MVGLDPTLVIKSGVPTPEAIALVRSTTILGKHPNSDIVLENPYVSRSHAKIQLTGDQATIQDLASKNGTYVDGVRVRSEPAQLSDGSVIELGRNEVTATFYLAQGTLTLENVNIGRIESNDASFAIDEASRRVWIDGQVVDPPLAKKPFDILLLLSSKTGQICSHAEISRAGWPEREGGVVDDVEIRQHIHRIRSGLGIESDSKVQITNARGFGYRLDID